MKPYPISSQYPRTLPCVMCQTLPFSLPSFLSSATPRLWRSTPPARERTARRRECPVSLPPLFGGRGGPPCFPPGTAPASSSPRSSVRLSLLQSVPQGRETQVPPDPPPQTMPPTD